MFYACIKGFYWTHVSAFLNIFNQFWCWYNTALFYTVTLLIFLVFYWRYKKNNWLWFHIAKKNCDPRNLHCMKLLAASAARIWHAQHPFNLLPYCLYRYQRVATILYQTVIYVACTCTIKITATFLFVPLLLNHQSAIFLVLKSIKCRVTLFLKIKF